MASTHIPKYPFPNAYNHKIAWISLGGHTDLDVEGHIIINKEKNYLKIMLFKDLSGDMGYYREQNKVYPKFLTSWQKLTTPMKKCLGWIQKTEFIDWSVRTPYFKHFARCAMK